MASPSALETPNPNHNQNQNQNPNPSLFSQMTQKNTIMSAVANLSTAYNLTIISLALSVTAYVYPENHETAASTTSQVKTAALIGCIIGQLFMGYIGDLVGRSRAMALTMSLTILGAALSSIDSLYGASTPGPDITGLQLNSTNFKHGKWSNPKDAGDDSMHSTFAWLIFCRLLLGIGVGGVYPLAATVAAESSQNKATRGAAVSLVFSTQGIGFLLCPIVILILIGANPSSDVKPECDPGNNKCNPQGCISFYHVDYHVDHHGNATHLSSTGHCSAGANDANWRIALLLGALPGLILMPFKVSETSKAVASGAPVKNTFWSDLGNSKYWGDLVGTAGGWFLFDIVFYGNTLFAPTVTKQIWEGDLDLYQTAVQTAILYAIALPGYWVATWLMDRLGRKNIQIIGFTMMTILYVILAFIIGLDTKKGDPPKVKGFPKAALLILYGLTFFFANFGPNSTTFILPSETYPANVRTSFNGFSAASGKVGAAIGSALFGQVAAHGVGVVLLACGAVSLAGIACTVFFVKDFRGKEMKGDDSTYEENTALLPVPGNTHDRVDQYEHMNVNSSQYDN